MKHVGTIVGTAIAGMFVMTVWGAFAAEWGIIGGWLAGLVIIGTMWVVNHYVGIHNNDGAWVDMALGIGTVGFMRVVFEQGAGAGIASIPTLAFVLIGGMIGGFTAFKLEKHIEQQKAAASEESA
ncbi:hypothetical protein SAMN05660297_01925 [Natronincola peptidivorans]|uniref:Uncharacterized protein n=1 Tax=Natronincola peptidivorans TaxID=426128 RepID=A0A1I0D987_9FIRM|nr:hypothetical protein [Natronincola peptidivorans]SET28773.1 hypothetical protein SAMN05660297_01925 [Natronincola peptidivorans]